MFFLLGCTKSTKSKPSTINRQPQTVNHQPSTVNHQMSTINRQPSTVNHKPSTINHYVTLQGKTFKSYEWFHCSPFADGFVDGFSYNILLHRDGNAILYGRLALLLSEGGENNLPQYHEGLKQRVRHFFCDRRGFRNRFVFRTRPALARIHATRRTDFWITLFPGGNRFFYRSNCPWIFYVRLGAI